MPFDRRKNVLLVCFFLSVSFHRGFSQSVPEDRDVLESGVGAGMALYADRNGYPGPEHILEMQEALGLTDGQLKQTEALYEEMAARAKSKGAQIIALEEELSSTFIGRSATEERVRELSERIGAARGELRAIHLVTHLQAAQILNEDQTARYNILRETSRDQQHHHQMK